MVEDKLKELIKRKYGSVRKFTLEFEMPYSTVATVFSRGVAKTNINTILSICKALGLSADALADGKIEFLPDSLEVSKLATELKIKILTSESMLDGRVLSPQERKEYCSAIDVAIETTSQRIRGERK